MTALSISLIATGVALVCAGLVFSPSAGADPDHPDDLRTILDALDEEDRGVENRDLGETGRRAICYPRPRPNERSNSAPHLG